MRLHGLPRLRYFDSALNTTLLAFRVQTLLPGPGDLPCASSGRWPPALSWVEAGLSLIPGSFCPRGSGQALAMPGTQAAPGEW